MKESYTEIILKFFFRILQQIFFDFQVTKLKIFFSYLSSFQVLRMNLNQ